MSDVYFSGLPVLNDSTTPVPRATTVPPVPRVTNSPDQPVTTDSPDLSVTTLPPVPPTTTATTVPTVPPSRPVIPLVSDDCSPMPDFSYPADSGSTDFGRQSDSFIAYNIAPYQASIINQYVLLSLRF